MGNGIFDTLTSQPQSPSGNGVFDQIHEDAAQPPKKDWLDTVTDFGRGLWSKVNPVSQVQGAAQLAAHPIGSYVADASKRQAIMDNAEADFKKGDYATGVARSLYSIIPFLGPQMESAGTKMQNGQMAEGLGESAGMGLQLSTPALVRGAKAGVSALPDVSDLRQSAADALTKPSGALKPVPSALARAAGAGIGYSTGLPEGGLVGALTGPSALRALIGNRTPVPEVPEAELGSPENPGWVVKLPNRIPSSQIATAGEHGPELPGVNVIPEPRGEFTDETPNYMASIPRTDLLKLARSGKPGAGVQLQQLGKTVIYAPKGAGIKSPTVISLRDLLQELHDKAAD